jgi:hypothetical protein
MVWPLALDLDQAGAGLTIANKPAFAMGREISPQFQL